MKTSKKTKLMVPVLITSALLSCSGLAGRTKYVSKQGITSMGHEAYAERYSNKDGERRILRIQGSSKREYLRAEDKDNIKGFDEIRFGRGLPIGHPLRRYSSNNLEREYAQITGF